ncbi:MAG: hypothetical protein H6709_14565 [Kofleriaceae bacterium]|nr:hypothetical protein [Myxococcales bacterium]MCB9573301.1 hypothetical protein [Kofleriaceae bacterium]
MGRPWIVGTLTVLTCATFAGRAAGHAIAWRLEVPTVADPPAMARSPQTPPARPDGNRGLAFVDRNLFCSACTSRRADDPPVPGDGDVPATRLPLVLVATSLGAAPQASWATVRNTASGAEGAFGLGARIPGAGVVERIAGTFVWIRGEAGLERIDLLAEVATATPPRDAHTAGAAAGKAAPAWQAQVRQLDDHTWEVDRQLIRDLVGQQARLPGVRMAPATRDGKLTGIRVAYARPDSLAAGLGLATGDVIEALDGHALDSPDALLGAYAGLDGAAAVQVSVTRRGKPVELGYRLR